MKGWRRRAGRIGGAVLGCVLSLSLVVVAAPPANAFVPAPLLVGTAFVSPPIVTAGGTSLAVSAGLAIGPVGWAGLGLMGVAGVAYATRDSWVPVVEGFFNPDEGSQQDGNGNPTGCSVTMSPHSFQPPDKMNWYVNAQACTANHWSVYPGPARVNTLSIQCMAMQTYTISGTPSITRHKGDIYSVGSRNDSGTTGGPQGGGPPPQIVQTGGTAGLCPNTVAGMVDDIVVMITATGLSAGGNTKSGASNPEEYFPHVPEDVWKHDTRVDCMRPDGSTFQITASEVGHSERLSVPSCYAVDPTSIPTLITTTGPAGTPQTTTTTTLPTPTEWGDQYPLCFGPSGLLCTIVVEVDGLPCAVGMPGCPGWWTNTKDPTNPWFPRTDCTFGPYVVPRANCEPLKRSYRPDAPPEGTPQLQPDWGADPEPDAPPQTNPNPSPSPSGSTSPNPNPTGGTSSLPTTGPNPNPPPITPETNPDSQSCLGANWSWNPVSWVYAPVKCALVWAFVPKSPPGFGNIPSPIPEGWLPSLHMIQGGQCGPLTMPSLDLVGFGIDTGDRTLFNTCSAPWPMVRAFTYWGLLAGVMVTVGNRALRAAMTAVGMGVDTPAGGDDS